MTCLPRVLHLVDDATPGGVMRVVDYIISSLELAKGARHEQVRVVRGKMSTKRLEADIIVSHLTINWRGIPCLIAMRIANSGIPMVHVEHSYTERFVVHNVERRGRFATLLRVGYSQFDRIVAVSHGQAQWLESRRLCSAKKLTTIQSCADMAPFRALSAPTGPTRIFGAIGRLDRQKGFDILIKAFMKCPEQDIALHIYGEGQEELYLKNIAAGDRRIVFKGFTASSVAAFAQVDAVIMPSRWEAYGLVAIEALSAGRRLLCSDVDGLRDHEINGAKLFGPTSTLSLSKKISQLGREPDETLKSTCRQSDFLEKRFLEEWTKLVSTSKESARGE